MDGVISWTLDALVFALAAIFFVYQLLVRFALLLVNDLNVGPVESDHGGAVKAEIFDHLLHGLLAYKYGPIVVQVALVFLHLALPLGLEVTAATVVRLLVAMDDKMASEITEIAGQVGTLLTAERRLGASLGGTTHRLLR